MHKGSGEGGNAPARICKRLRNRNRERQTLVREAAWEPGGEAVSGPRTHPGHRRSPVSVLLGLGRRPGPARVGEESADVGSGQGRRQRRRLGHGVRFTSPCETRAASGGQRLCPALGVLVDAARSRGFWGK